MYIGLLLYWGYMGFRLLVSSLLQVKVFISSRDTEASPAMVHSLYRGYMGFRNMIPIMENQIQKNMEKKWKLW